MRRAFATIAVTAALMVGGCAYPFDTAEGWLMFADALKRQSLFVPEPAADIYNRLKAEDAAEARDAVAATRHRQTLDAIATRSWADTGAVGAVEATKRDAFAPLTAAELKRWCVHAPTAHSGCAGYGNDLASAQNLMRAACKGSAADCDL